VIAGPQAEPRPVLPPAAEGGVRVRTVVACIIIFWICNGLSQSIQMVLMNLHQWRLLPPRASVTVAAMLISYGIWRGYERLIGRPMAVKIAAALGFTLCGCFVHSIANFTIFQVFLGRENWASADLQSYLSALLGWFWAYAAMSSLLLALSYAAEVSQLQRTAHAAQLRALRYQLNPHFMFNKLNSIAALIGEGCAEPAEHMVENLADFLRATISLDPEADIPLRDELQLQSLYFAIESLRFSDRLEISVSASDEALDALVPALITQPLAENVIRHAVANSTRAIRFEVKGSVVDGRLLLVARNTPPDGAVRSQRSTGLGLRNVAERLRARFGNAGTLAAGRDADGAFSVEIGLPYVII
jgi:sensor histidine kinase YesM